MNSFLIKSYCYFKIGINLSSAEGRGKTTVIFSAPAIRSRVSRCVRGADMLY